MVKILLVLFVFIPVNVMGSVCYTDYSFKERTDKFYEENELLKREEVKLYRNIKVDKDYKYTLIDECDGKVVLDDYKAVKDYKKDYLAGYNAVVNLRSSYIEKVRYLMIYDYDIVPPIKHIDVFYKDELLSYDELFDVKSPYLDSNPYLIIDLNKAYDFKDLSFIIYYDGEFEGDSANYTLFFSYDSYVPPLLNKYITNIYVNRWVSEQYVDVVDDKEYDEIFNSLGFKTPYSDAINYFYKEEKHYGCLKENVIKGDYKENSYDDYKLDYNDYIIVYDYYERNKIEVSDVINSVDDVFTLVKGKVSNIKSNIDLNKNGNYDLWVNNHLFNVSVDIPGNNKEIKINSMPSFKERIVYKYLDNNAALEEKKCATFCEHKKCKQVIIILCILVIYLIGKNRYILTKGYKL